MWMSLPGSHFFSGVCQLKEQTYFQQNNLLYCSSPASGETAECDHVWFDLQAQNQHHPQDNADDDVERWNSSFHDHPHPSQLPWPGVWWRDSILTPLCHVTATEDWRANISQIFSVGERIWKNYICIKLLANMADFFSHFFVLYKTTLSD